MARAHTLTLAEAAERLQVSTKTIRRRIADGSLTAYRVGPRLVRVSETELEDLLRVIPSAKSA